MLEINNFNHIEKEDKSFIYKVLKAFLILVSSIIMLYYIAGIVNYVTSGPSITLMEDLTTDFIVLVILMGLGLFYLIIAWFRHISYGIVSIVFTFLYVLYISFLNHSVTIGFLPIAMAADAFGFILLGLMQKLKKKRDFNVFAEPITDELEGPNVFNFRI